jgi:hypothetical protein
MNDFEVQLAALRAEADRELLAQANGNAAQAEVTMPAWVFLELLDALDHHRGNTP